MKDDEAYLRQLLQGIVLNPEQIRLERSEDPRGILFRIQLTKADMPIVVGRAGQTIKAIRWLMKLYAKEGSSISLILEEPAS